MTATDKFTQQKKAMLARRRRVVFNNDGCDVFALPENSSPNPENLLALRTARLVDTHVDTISYCTISSGFSLFTHNTKIGEVLRRKHPSLGNNIAPALIEDGRDCLEIMVDFGHRNEQEVFWSMRMNDTHDGAHRQDNPYFLFPRLKQENPQYLLGTPERPPCHGSWSAVDYAHPEIRRLAFDFVEEVCQNYDVDGIELDFFRHPVFFKSVSQGFPASNQERSQMTALMRKIAAMVETEGRKRGRPLLIAVRTPDDLDYATTIGLELERWMAEKLIDIYIPSAYIRLNPWRYSVRLGHKYGVRVYPGLSESRVGGGHHRDPLRASDQCYRARALNAWQAGADGVYIFNLFDPHRKIWSELGEPKTLEKLDKIYFASNRGIGRVAGGAYPHQHFITVPTVNPEAPLAIDPGEGKIVKIQIGNCPASPPASDQPELKLGLKFKTELSETEDIMVNFNGRRLQGEINAAGLEYDLNPEIVRAGDNTVEIRQWETGKQLLLADVMISCNYPSEILKDK